MRKTITVKNIDPKLFNRQRMALLDIMGEVEESWSALSLPVPSDIQKKLNTLEGLVNLTDHMSDLMDGIK